MQANTGFTATVLAVLCITDNQKIEKVAICRECCRAIRADRFHGVLNNGKAASILPHRGPSGLFEMREQLILNRDLGSLTTRLALFRHEGFRTVHFVQQGNHSETLRQLQVVRESVLRWDSRLGGNRDLGIPLRSGPRLVFAGRFDCRYEVTFKTGFDDVRTHSGLRRKELQSVRVVLGHN